MYIAWTKHLKDPEDKKKFENSVWSSKHVLDHLKSIIDSNITDLDHVEVNPKNYEIPNWDYRQAHNNGYRQAMFTLRKLIDLDQQDKKEEKA